MLEGMQEPLILAYDGTEESDAAAVWAAQYARASGLRLATMVVADPNDWTREAQEGTAAERAEKLALTATGVLDSAGIVEPDVEIHYADVVKTLLQAAQNATMVVLGARGRGRLSGAFEGSVSQSMSHRTPSPLVLVRQVANPSSTRVVVGMDEDEHSRRALEFAVTVATTLEYSILVCHGTKSTASIRDKFRKPDANPSGCEAVEQLVAAARAKHPDVEISVEHSSEDPVAQLVEATHDAAIVVVGSRGHHGIRGWWARSVSREVMHQAACVVAVVS